MRALVCGDRNWTDKDAILRALASLKVDVVIEGEAKGADTLARMVAEESGIPVLAFPADWNKYGRAAGPIRNRQMLDEGRPDLVLAFHSNITESKGTKNMIEQAGKRGIPTRLYNGRHNLCLPWHINLPKGGRIMKYVGFIVAMMATAFLILISGFTLPTSIALLVLILAITADFYTTWRCLKARGREGNPMVAFLFRRIGLRASFCLMVGLWVLIIIFRFLPAVEGVQTAIALVYWVVPLNNLVVLRRLRRKNYA